jgi:site-specific DNA recombinase
MMPTHTKKRNRCYRYYVCVHAQKRGWKECPSRSIPAMEIERFVVEQIKCIGEDQGLIAAALLHAKSQGKKRVAELQVEHDTLTRDLRRYDEQMRKLVAELPKNMDDETSATTVMADLQERIRTGERRLTEIREETLTINRRMVNEEERTSALATFDRVWETLSPGEQARILHLLIERIDYDGGKESVAITFRPSGIKALSEGRNPEEVS